MTLKNIVSLLSVPERDHATIAEIMRLVSA